jgi:hypothetical protein
MISGVLVASCGALQSVQSYGTAKLPRSAWRLLRTGTPETRRTFSTEKR